MNVPRLLRRLFRRPFDGLRHFGVVEQGVLYRCGQPRPEELRKLIADYGIRTVVSLRGSRGESDPDAWEREEREVCTGLDVAFVAIPCNHKTPPTKAQVDEFLAITANPARRPVLVHCRLGQQRTLLFCALFRVAAHGLDPQSAEREMDQLGFGAHVRRHQRLLLSFRELAGALAQQRPTTPPPAR